MIYTRRQLVKKLWLVLLLGVLLGWCAHILTVQAVIHYHQSKPIILGSVAHAQQAQKAQVYQVKIHNFFGRVLYQFKGGKVFWADIDRGLEIVKKRFKLSPGIYWYCVTGANQQSIRIKFMVGDNPDPGK